MKHVVKVAVAVVLFVAATGVARAQSKTAHINVTELLQAMPEMKAAQAELKRLEETYRADIQGSMEELQNKFTQYSVRLSKTCRTAGAWLRKETITSYTIGGNA